MTAPPPPARVLAAVQAVAARLAGADVPWTLTGSAALLLAGVPVRPADVDLEVAEGDATRACHLLGLPAPRPSEGGGWSSLRAQGAIAGVAVDLSAGLVVTGPGGTLRADDAATLPGPAGGAWAGAMRVVHPGEALARAMVAGHADRRAKALTALGHADPGRRAEALAYAEERARSAAR